MEEEEEEEEEEGEEPPVSQYLSSAKAAVEAELAAVDAQLEKAGHSPSRSARPASVSEAPGAAAEDDIDAAALYSRALEELGANAETEAMRAKVRAVRRRAQQRREAELS